jgi:hypothetical protein
MKLTVEEKLKRKKQRKIERLAKRLATSKAINKEKRHRKNITESLDKICSLICKWRANNKCEICGNVGTQAHHNFSKKAFPFLRWNIDNLLWLCFACHIRKIHQQGQYELARDVLILKLGISGYEQLKVLAYRVYEGLKPKFAITPHHEDLLENLKKQEEIERLKYLQNQLS